MTTFVSHRGLGTGFVEQTTQAFRAAIACGVGALEVDLRASRDGVIVLVHNKTCVRTHGDTRVINTLGYDVIRQFRSRDGQPIMTFEEFARDFQHCRWILDIKRRSGMRVIEGLRRWANDPRNEQLLLGNCHAVTWEPAQRDTLRRMFPQLSHALNPRECAKALGLGVLGRSLHAGWQPGDVIGVPAHLLSLGTWVERTLNRLRAQGARIMLYLPRNESDVERALRFRLDYVLTDRPDLVRTRKRAVAARVWS